MKHSGALKSGKNKLKKKKKKIIFLLWFLRDGYNFTDCSLFLNEFQVALNFKKIKRVTGYCIMKNYLRYSNLALG